MKKITMKNLEYENDKEEKNGKDEYDKLLDKTNKPSFNNFTRSYI